MKNLKCFKTIFFFSFSLMVFSSCQWGVKDVGVRNEDGDVEIEPSYEVIDLDWNIEREEITVDEGAPEEFEEEPDTFDIEELEEVDGGCTSSEQCNDGEMCNGEETCSESGICEQGTNLPNGTICSDTEGNPGRCRDGVCITTGCGNGIADDGEECDDGQNGNPDDGCRDDCTYSCHNNGDCRDADICNGEEICNTETSHTCTSGTLPEDGFVCLTEPRSICLSGICSQSTCGDNFVDTGVGEMCEPSLDSRCRDDCTYACTINSDCPPDGNICNGEEYCDEGTRTCQRRNEPAEGTVCQEDPRKICISLTCQSSICGDRFIDTVSGEECDDGNATEGDGCDNDCTFSCHVITQNTECNDGLPCNEDLCNETTHTCYHEISPTTKVCRPSAGTCDVAEYCDGVNSTCPNDLFLSSETVCRPSAGDCDVAENCTGSSATCPADSFLPNTTVCRPSAGDCDVPETCTGSSATCPADSFLPNTTVCRPSAGDCDVPETCTGTSAQCPTDSFRPDTYVCRASAGDCDVPENCTGSSAQCPTDSFRPNTYVCRASAGDCDVPENCTGSSATCPADSFLPNTTVCRPASGECDAPEYCSGTSSSCPANSFMPSGSPCTIDRIDCTDDACDGFGNCVATENDANCAIGELCLSNCAVDSTGCVQIPDYLDLTCTSPVTPPNSSNCTIDLNGLQNQTSCISCSSEVGVVLLDYSDFGDGEGGCNQDGWTFVSGNNCSDNVNNCALTGAQNKPCESNFNNICTNLFGIRYVLQADDAVGQQQWRMRKSFNTTGLTNLSLCFELGDNGVTGTDEALYAYVEDSLHTMTQVFCINGEPQPGVNYVLYPYCVNLPSWAENNSNITITFIAHSEQNGNVVYLDSVSLRGWKTPCSPSTQTILNDNFDSCDLTGWTFTGTPTCPGTWSCGGTGSSLQATNQTWTIQRQVDASNLDGNVTLCFSYGDNTAGLGSSINVQFNSNDGNGWQTAWFQIGNLGPDQTCRNICVNLSDIDSDVNRNAALEIRFSVGTIAGQSYDLDNILLRGSTYCNDSVNVSLSPISESGGGFYSFTATETDVPATRLDADINCSWGRNPPVYVQDWTTINFIP